MSDIGGRSQLRINRKGKPQLFLDKPDFRIILRIPYPRYGPAVTRLLCDQTAEQIDLILVGHSDQKIRRCDTSLSLNAKTRPVSTDPHNIQIGRYILNLLLIGINDRQVMSFRRQLFNQRVSYLAASYHDYLHVPSASKTGSFPLFPCMILRPLFCKLLIYPTSKVSQKQ